MAWKENSKGEMSAMCFGTLHPIDMKRESWTLTPSAVTCRPCLKVLKFVKILVKPKICPEENQPAFDSPESMEAFMRANEPHMKIMRVARCIACGLWHAKTEPEQITK